MRSETAWRAGHRAAILPAVIAFAVALLFSLIGLRRALRLRRFDRGVRRRGRLGLCPRIARRGRRLTGILVSSGGGVRRER